MTQFLFYIIAIVGLLYFLLKKRRFDFFAIGYLSAIIYFLPGFFGFVLDPIDLEKINLVDQTYLVMIIVLVIIFFSASVNDLLTRDKGKTITFKETKYNVRVLFLLSIISFILMLVTSGPGLFSPVKTEMMNHLNRFHLIWTVSTSILTVATYLNKNYKLFSICLFFLLFDVFIGFRETFAITLIAVLTLYLFNKGPQRLLIQNSKMLFLGTMAAMFLFVYKQIQAVLKLGRWDIVFERLMNPSFYLDSIIYSEPFITQTILNEVIKQNFTTEPEYLLNIIYLFVFFAPQLGANIVDFNSLFQKQLFPSVDYGMASNIWAEMYSVNGYAMVIFFLLIFIIIIIAGNKLLSISDVTFEATLSIIMIYWVFYVHRNSLIYEINLNKRVIIIFIVITIISYVIVRFEEKLKN